MINTHKGIVKLYMRGLSKKKFGGPPNYTNFGTILHPLVKCTFKLSKDHSLNSTVVIIFTL